MSLRTFLLLIPLIGFVLSQNVTCREQFTCEACQLIPGCSWCGSNHLTNGFCEPENEIRCSNPSNHARSVACTPPFCSSVLSTPLKCQYSEDHRVRTNDLGSCHAANLGTLSFHSLMSVECQFSIESDGELCTDALQSYLCTSSCSECPDPLSFHPLNTSSLPSIGVCRSMITYCPRTSRLTNCLSSFPCTQHNPLETIEGKYNASMEPPTEPPSGTDDPFSTEWGSLCEKYSNQLRMNSSELVRHFAGSTFAILSFSASPVGELYRHMLDTETGRSHVVDGYAKVFAYFLGCSGVSRTEFSRLKEIHSDIPINAKVFNTFKETVVSVGHTMRMESRDLGQISSLIETFREDVCNQPDCLNAPITFRGEREDKPVVLSSASQMEVLPLVFPTLLFFTVLFKYVLNK